MTLKALAVCISLVYTAVLADVEFLEPTFGSAHKGGHEFTASWRESGVRPYISELESYQLYLSAGGTDENTVEDVAVLVDHGHFEQGNSVSFKVPRDVGGNGENSYFLKMVSRSADTTVVNFSDRFTMSEMTGTFSPDVQRGIQSLAAQPGNDPKERRRLRRRQQQNGAAGANAWANGGGAVQGAAGGGAGANGWANDKGDWQVAAGQGAGAGAGTDQRGNGGAGGAWQGAGGGGANAWANGGVAGAGAGGGAITDAGAISPKDPHTVPYAEQTGTIRYAPVPKQPGTTITAKTPKRQFPTSPYHIATTFLPPATVVQTVYATRTITVAKVENSASPAPHPNARRDKID